MRRTNHNPSAEFAHLFPDREFRSRGSLGFRHLPYIVRPIIEHIHETKPDIVVAGDRGGRFFAVTAMKSWAHRYPEHHFPTASGKIHMARVTKRSASGGEVAEATRWTLQQAGIDEIRKKAEQDGKAPSVLYMDDWAVYGGTVDRFISAAKKEGIPKKNITYATLCGHPVGDSVTHIIGDPDINPRRSEWDSEGGNEAFVGVNYSRSAPTIPIAAMNPDAVRARQYVDLVVDQYYENFDAAIQSGTIAACSCVAIQAVPENV